MTCRIIIYTTSSVLRLLVVYHRCGVCAHEVRHDRRRSDTFHEIHDCERLTGVFQNIGGIQHDSRTRIEREVRAIDPVVPFLSMRWIDYHKIPNQRTGRFVVQIDVWS